MPVILKQRFLKYKRNKFIVTPVDMHLLPKKGTDLKGLIKSIRYDDGDQSSYSGIGSTTTDFGIAH